MSGILYVVATPIGNLEDVTLRALRILREVSVIAAEDTRRTSRLLQHYSISTPTTSLHEHNEHARTPQLIERLKRGESVALVSDAGTPVVSDPGRKLVNAAHAARIPVQPIPGASAVTAIVSAAGVGEEGFTFAGFPPAKANARRRWLQGLKDSPRPVVIYEAPHRIRLTLVDIAAELGERNVAIGRELTKTHEELAVRPTSAWLASLPPELGEFVLIIYPVEHPPSDLVNDQTLVAEFRELSATGSMARRETMREVARRHNVTPNQVFRAIEAAKHEVE